MKMATVSALAAGMLASGVPLVNASDIEPNVALTTDYRFRGISQTSRNPAIQGGFDWTHKSGFYLGTWGSNVDFAGSLELDAYLGYGNDFGADGKANYDVGLLGYFYPGGNKTTIEEPAGSGNFNKVNVYYYEIYGALGYDFGVVDGKLGVNYSPDFQNESGAAWYPYVDVDVPLPKDWGIVAHLGYQYFDDEKKAKNNLEIGQRDYVDYKLGVSKAFWGVDWELSLIGTNLSKNDCPVANTGSKNCSATGVFTVSKSF